MKVYIVVYENPYRFESYPSIEAVYSNEAAADKHAERKHTFYTVHEWEVLDSPEEKKE